MTTILFKDIKVPPVEPDWIPAVFNYRVAKFFLEYNYSPIVCVDKTGKKYPLIVTNLQTAGEFYGESNAT